jgi:predicted nucleotidyltransferase
MHDLENLLQRKADVVSERALHWYIRDRVLAVAEATPL